MSVSRFETLHGFAVHVRPVGERANLVTLLTQEHCKQVVFFKHSVPELGRQFEVKIQRSSKQINAGDFRYLDPVLVQSNSAKYYLLYINELAYRLAQSDAADEQFYAAYMRALVSINFPESIQSTLREFEWALLNDLGQAIDFRNDATHRSIKNTARYDFLPGKGFTESPRGRYSGEQIEAAGKLDTKTPGAMATARECLFAQISHLLNGQSIESRQWLKSLVQR